MKNLKQHLYIIAVGLVFFSCEEPVILEIPDAQDQIVIEGLITNADLNYVKVTKSRSFYESGLAEAVPDATVTVTNLNGTAYVFEHNPENDPELEGIYSAPAGFIGEINNSYALSVIAEGVEYTAQETLMPVTTIDSLTVEVDFEEMEDPEDEGRFYEVIFFAQEPQDRIDHYLFKFYRNDTLVKDFAEDIYFAEDEFLGSEIDDLPIAGYYALDDTVRVEMYSITREAFVFYVDLFNLINGDGGMFSPPPANPRNNLSNGAFGYFQVSALDSETIIVKEPDN